MWRLLKKLSLFFCLLFLFDALLVCLGGEFLPTSVTKPFVRYRRCGGGHLFSRLKEARNVKDVDLLVLGTSHAYRGYDTRIFGQAGYRTFNLGSSIQTALQTELLLERYLDSIRPKRVIFDVNPVIFGNDGSESAADVISNDHIDWHTMEMAFKVNKFKVYNTLLFGVYRQIAGRDAHLDESDRYGHDHYISGGYVETKLNKNHAAHKVLPAVAYQFANHQQKAFDHVLKMLKDRKIPYVLVQAPVTHMYYASKTNNGYTDSLLATKGRYYNFNGRLTLDQVYDFYDNNHLSQQGVEKYNHVLIGTLEEDGFLPGNIKSRKIKK